MLHEDGHCLLIASTLDTFEQWLPLALERWTNKGSTLHGPEHWQRVAEMGAELAAATKNAVPAIVGAFAAIHDCLRVNDTEDPGHGPRAAELAGEVASGFGFARNEIRMLQVACAGHTSGQRHPNPTVSCCWDADRLDLTRLGIKPKGTLMSTSAGRAWARTEDVQRP